MPGSGNWAGAGAARFCFPARVSPTRALCSLAVPVLSPVPSAECGWV